MPKSSTSFQLLLREALCVDSEHSHASEELYEVPYGDQVNCSPPAPTKEYYLQEFVPESSLRAI
eukprot:9418465-Pyramimonas_sp.AAC.1